MSPNFALCFQSCLSSLKMALKTLWKMLCIAVHSSKCGVLKPGLANFLWLYIASSIHQFMIFMVALPSPKQPKAAETSEDLQVNKLAGGKSYNYKYHTLGKQVWKNVSSFHQFSHLRENRLWRLQEWQKIAEFAPSNALGPGFLPSLIEYDSYGQLLWSGGFALTLDISIDLAIWTNL